MSSETSLLKSLALVTHFSASLSKQTRQRDKIRVCEIRSMRASLLPVTLIPGNACLVDCALCEQKRETAFTLCHWTTWKSLSLIYSYLCLLFLCNMSEQEIFYHTYITRSYNWGQKFTYSHNRHEYQGNICLFNDFFDLFLSWTWMIVQHTSFLIAQVVTFFLKPTQGHNYN